MFINYSVFDKKMQYWMIYDFFKCFLTMFSFMSSFFALVNNNP